MRTRLLAGSSRFCWVSFLGGAVGAFQGFWIAYRGVPAFIVTLAGLFMFRGGAWLMTQGRTVAPLDDTFQLLGGGLNGSIGGFWSWVVGLVAIAGIVTLSLGSRAKRGRLGFPVRPLWAEALVLGASIALIIAFVLVMNAYTLPRTDIARGIPVPVLILIGVAVLMTALARPHQIRALRVCDGRLPRGGAARRD